MLSSCAKQMKIYLTFLFFHFLFFSWEKILQCDTHTHKPKYFNTFEHNLQLHEYFARKALRILFALVCQTL